MDFEIREAARQSRLLALVRPLLVLPHIVIVTAVLWPLQLLVSGVAAVSILATGRYPVPLFRFSVGCLRWWANVATYVFSLRDEYPPFSLGSGGYPLIFDVWYPQSPSRIGVAIKLFSWSIFLIFVVYFISWLWIAPWVTGLLTVVIYGRWRPRARGIVVGALQLYTQLYALMSFLTDQRNPFSLERDPTAAPRRWPSMPPAGAGTVAQPRQDAFGAGYGYGQIPQEEVAFEVNAPETLPTFADIGGMEDVKRELHETIGLLLAFPDMAAKYGVRWNGVLLHGPPGTGKTFLAQATAGEFALNFISVGAGELLSAYRGRSAQRVVQAFETAQKNLPCLLFFDEFDSVALRRGTSPQPEERNTVNQLLRSVEKFRDVPDLVIMAATNDPDRLDAAVVRPGRFDRRIRIDLPDQASREAILRTILSKRPAHGVDFAEVAADCEGMSVASLRQIVEMASLGGMQAESAGGPSVITTAMLIEALRSLGGKDRPLAAQWNWDQLVVPEKTREELQQFERFIEDPDLAVAYGVEPPSGVLLYGPPGTGKTTIAKVLAAQAQASFYAITPADLMSKWVGETEENIADAFRRARENRPSIVFIDEIDALFPKRGVVGSFDDRWTDQLLQEIDGMRSHKGVFVVGATNRPDILDEALLRGGRLSRQIEIPLPDQECRERLLNLMTTKMPLHNVDTKELAARTNGFSGADLKALAQDAAMKSAIRTTSNRRLARVTVEHRDFLASLSDFQQQKEAI